jgi:phospholipase C
MRSPFWKSTAIIVMYDDSDGWYDHQMSPIVNPAAVLNTASSANGDQLNSPGVCGHGTPLGGIQGRCGYGPRLPLLVISPFAKTNFVDHTLTDQSSVLRFIEENWGTGQIGGGSYDQLAGPLWNMFDFGDHAFPGQNSAGVSSFSIRAPGNPQAKTGKQAAPASQAARERAAWQPPSCISSRPVSWLRELKTTTLAA